MNIEDILVELGNQMGLPNLKLDENKVCRLIFDKKYTVDIEASEDMKTVHVYSAIDIIPPSNKEELYESILEANLFGRGTGGAAFGVDLEMGEILLSISVKMEKTDYQDFVNVLESFVNHVEAWTEKIDTGSFAHEKSTPPSRPGGPSSGGSSTPPPPPPSPDAGPPPGYIMA